MKPITRRSFLKRSTATGLALSLPRFAGRAGEASDAVRLGVVGLGSTTAAGGVGGRGHQLIGRLRNLPGARITALCDVDQEFLDRESRPFKDQNQEVATYRDLRRAFDDKNVDAVVIALPNHWHALATIWACQAGKDVYVEKPFSYDIWEGSQMVAAARKYGRMVQVGTQNRSSLLLRQVFADVRRGEIGATRYAHTLVYRPRDGIGTVSAPTPVPTTVDYDLWCGPAPMAPLMRKQLHYDWHWFWATGNGEMGNNGIHVNDLCRWALDQSQPPPRAISIGGRFAFNDGGETANTQIALLDYKPAPILCEIRNVRTAPGPNAMGRFRNQNRGIVIECEGGYFAGDGSGGAFFDNQDKKIRDVMDQGESSRLEASHLSNFLDAVRSRKSADLKAEAQDGHVSAACCHMANISHRLGKQSPPESVKEALRADQELAGAFDRCREYLRENGVDLGATPATLGPWVTFDPNRERFVGADADRANGLSRRDYRTPFVVPELT